MLILVSLLSLFTRGLNLGIEFEGGVAWEFPAANTSVSETRSTLEHYGISDGKIQTLRGADGERIRAQAGPQTGVTSSGVRQTLADNAQVDIGEVSFTSIGPTWGAEITHKAIRALIIFFIVLALYITVRFEWRMAVAALAAVAHDVLISVGVYSLFGFEVTPATVIAFLTILGFSLYDTIVVFDKVHENTRRVLATGRATYGDVVNLSMNQVLARSLNTTLCAVLPGHVAALRRVDPDGRDRAGGLRARAARRPHHRLVLVDLHRHADPGCAQGARASLPSAEGQVRQHDGALDDPGRDRGRDSRCHASAPGRAGAATPGVARAPSPAGVATGASTGDRARPSSSPAQEEEALSSAPRLSTDAGRAAEASSRGGSLE